MNNIYNTAIFALNLNTEAMARLQEQASTGSRINRSSDDPSAAYQILGLNSQERSFKNYIDNLSAVISTLELSSSIVGNIMSAFTETKIRLTQITSGTYDQDPEARKRTAEGINDILEQVLSLANTEHNNQYLFGGGDTNSAPYLATRTNGEITKVTYQGSFENRNIEVAPGVQSSALYVGDNIFRSDDRDAPVFLGDTGAKAGTGTSSVSGDTWLTVIYDGSNYKLSIDDGASYTTVPGGGGTNQAVTNSQTGEVLYVDSTGINNTGVGLVSISGTHDIFNTLITLRDILKNKMGVSDAQLQKLRSNSLDTIDEISNLLVQTSVSVGSKVAFLDNLKDNLETVKYDASDEASRLQDADIAQIAIDLSRREVLYQMSLSIAARLMSMSLLNFIR